MTSDSERHSQEYGHVVRIRSALSCLGRFAIGHADHAAGQPRTGAAVGRDRRVVSALVHDDRATDEREVTLERRVVDTLSTRPWYVLLLTIASWRSSPRLPVM